jgi:hypothetical protein
LQIKRGVKYNTTKLDLEAFKIYKIERQGSPKLEEGKIAHTLFTLNFFESVVPYSLTLNKIAFYLGIFFN